MSYVATSRVDVEVNRQPGDKTRRQNGDQQMLVAKMVTMVNDPPDEQHEQYHCDDGSILTRRMMSHSCRSRVCDI